MDLCAFQVYSECLLRVYICPITYLKASIRLAVMVLTAADAPPRWYTGGCRCAIISEEDVSAAQLASADVTALDLRKSLRRRRL
jgi:hypothetical protein